MQKKFGVFGEPVVLQGSIIGLLIGLLAGYGFLPSTAADGHHRPERSLHIVYMGAVMVLIRRWPPC